MESLVDYVVTEIYLTFKQRRMTGILEKKEGCWVVRWSDLHSYAHGTHWVSTPLHPTEFDETKLIDGSQVEFEFIMGHDQTYDQFHGFAKILMPEEDAPNEDLLKANDVWSRVNKLRDAGKLHTDEINKDEPSALAFTPYDINYKQYKIYNKTQKQLSPKDKAKELINKFSNECLLTTDGGRVAAAIAVDEIINAVDEWTEDYYWQEVKQEIEKL